MKKVKFKKYKLGEAKFEEFGDVYYDGELVMGTVVYIDEAKTSMIPEGQYTMEGKVYTIGADGAISDVAEIIAEYTVSKEEMDALFAANAELAAKKLAAEIAAKEAEIKLKSEELALATANLTAANAKILSLKSQNQNGMKNKNNFSCTKEGYYNFLAAKKEGRVRSQITSLQGVYRAFDRQSEAAGKPTNFIKSIQEGKPISYNFASGVNFIGDVTDRANAISSLIRTELLESNEIFSNLANFGDGLGDIPFRAANEKNAKAFPVTLPTLSNSTIAYGVGQACDKTYSGKVNIAARTMDVGLWEANQAFCPDEWPDLFQSIWYVDDIQMPLEYILVDFIMDILVSDLASKLVFGSINLTPNAGQPVDGLYQQVLADADVIAAGHIIPQSAWTNANVQTQLRALVNASNTQWKTACKSKNAKKKRTPLMLIAPSIVDLYLEFIQNSDNNANADIIANGMDYSQFFASTAAGKVKFVLCEALELDDAGANKGKVILCDRENVIYGETKDTLTMYPWIYYDVPTGRILFRNRDFAGIGYAQSEYIVTNTIA